MYPVNLKLAKQPVVVVGGGRIAARKIQDLLAAEARVTVVSPSLAAAIDPQKVHWRKQVYTPQVLAGARLVFACTNDPVINRQVGEDAQWYQWVNNVSAKQQATFYNMATIRHGAVRISIGTDGHDPVLARRVKQALCAWLEKGGNVWN